MAPPQRELEVCTTRDAARLLGLSVTSVQKLVEQGVLEAWKTQGGHRRISLHSVRALLGKGNQERTANNYINDKNFLHILIAEDDPLHKAMYEKQFSLWNLPFKWTIQENGYLALMDLGRTQYDAVILDVLMPELNGMEVVKAINAANIQIEIAVVSSLEVNEVQKAGGLPPNAIFLRKPISFDELRGYLRGCLARKLAKHSSL